MAGRGHKGRLNQNSLAIHAYPMVKPQDPPTSVRDIIANGTVITVQQATGARIRVNG